jgi:hypothetical protein
VAEEIEATEHKQPDPVSAASPEDLRVALNLGWHMAQLYAQLRPAKLSPPSPSKFAATREKQASARDYESVHGESELPFIQLQTDLPGRGSFTDRQQTTLLLDEIEAALVRFGPRIRAAGFDSPNTAAWRELVPFIGSPETHYELARAILLDHVSLLSQLSAVDSALGKSYGLGRALADLTLRPNAADQQSFTSDLRSGRVAVMTDWLSELRSLLPPHAAAAVGGSVALWQRWADDPKWDNGPLNWGTDGSKLVTLFHAQGEDWRGYLTGEKLVLDRLSIEDYLRAGEFFAGRIRLLAGRFVAQYWRWLSLVGAAVAVAIAVLFFVGSDTAKIAGSAIAVLTGLGVTAQSARATAGKALSQVQGALWQAELDQAGVSAITRLPRSVQPKATDTPKPPTGLRAWLRRHLAAGKDRSTGARGEPLA